MTWIGPTDPRDRARLDAWCETVGPVILQPGSASAPPVADRVAIVTWNTHVGAGDVGKLVAHLRRGDLTGGAAVREFVLLLQEVRRRGTGVPAALRPSIALPSPIGAVDGEAAVPDLAGRLALNLLYAPSMRNGPRDEDRGNAILSTLPFDDPLIVELPFERQRRVALAARIHGVAATGERWQLRVATAHFDTSPAWTRGGPAAARGRQARALIDALAAKEEPTVIAGDLNTWWGDDEPAVRELRAAFPDARPLPGGTMTWSGPLGAGTRVDHMFARLDGGDVVVRRARERFGSDHYPLIGLVDVDRLAAGGASPLE